MRRIFSNWSLLAAITAAFAGCLPWSATTQPSLRGPPLVPAAANALFLTTVLLEQPVGDAFLDRELWETIPLATRGETRALHVENGLRAIVIDGNPPSRFVELLTSELAAVDSHLLTFALRKQEVIATNGPLETCAFRFLPELGGVRNTISLRHAACGWCVRPEALSDGRVTVACEPQVQHGERQDRFRPNGDGTQFTLQGEIPLERFPMLGFEVTLSARDYLVIGAAADQPESLGGAFFRVEAEGRARQRVLVIRAGKAGDRPADSLAGPKPKGGPSIAVEAARGRFAAKN